MQPKNTPTCPAPRALIPPMASKLAQKAYQIDSGFQPRSLASSLASYARRAGAGAPAGGLIRLIAQVLGDLDVQAGLQQLPDHRGQQALVAGQRGPAGQRDTLAASPVDQHARPITHRGPRDRSRQQRTLRRLLAIRSSASTA